MYGGGWLYGLPRRSRLHRLSLRARLSAIRVRSARSVSAIQDPSLVPADFGRRQDVASTARRRIPSGRVVRMPRTYDGRRGDRRRYRGFLNSQRLKGIHLAIKSGMLAAEAIWMPRSRRFLERNFRTFAQSRAELGERRLWKVRNYHQAFDHGMWPDAFTWACKW